MAAAIPRYRVIHWSSTTSKPKGVLLTHGN
jgi:hypothetical protein